MKKETSVKKSSLATKKSKAKNEMVKKIKQKTEQKGLDQLKREHNHNSSTSSLWLTYAL